MYIEFRNTTTDKDYYLCGTLADPQVANYNPYIEEHLLKLDINASEEDIFNIIRPAVDRLTEDNNDDWVVNVFVLVDQQRHSLTRADLAHSRAMYCVGDVNFIDDVKQPTIFHPFN